MVTSELTSEAIWPLRPHTEAIYAAKINSVKSSLLDLKFYADSNGDLRNDLRGHLTSEAAYGSYLRSKNKFSQK